MPRSVTPGSTDQTEYFYIVEDVGGSNPGEPKTGLTHTNLDSAYYVRTRGAAVQITPLSTLADPDSAHADGGFKEVDATNMPGVYRFDPPDAAYADGADETIVHLKVAAASAAIARPVKVVLGMPADVTEVNGEPANQAGVLDANVVQIEGADATDQINAACDAAIETYHLDRLLAADYDPASKPGVATALLNELVESDGGVSRFTANALEQAPSGGTNPNVLVDTTVASINSQTSIVLTAGADFDDAYNGQTVVLYDASNSDYPSVRKVTDYVGATRTVTLDSAPDFTLAASGDGVRVFATAPGTTAPTAAEVADAVWDEAQADHVAAGTFGEVATEVAAILLDTAEIGAAGAGLTEAGGTGDHLTAVPWNAAWDAEVESEASDALVALHLDHLLAADYDPAAKPGVATALLNELVESDAGVSRFTANALEQAPSGGGGVADWTADERTAIRTILGIPASGTTPEDPAAGILDAIRDLVVTVDGVVDVIAQDTGTSLPNLISALNDLSAADIDARLAAIHLDHLIASADPGGVVANDSFLAKLASKSATAAFADYDNTTDSLQALRDNQGTPQTGDAFARLGAPAGPSVSADVAAVKAETALIVADTNELQTDWADGGRLDLILDAAAADAASLNDTKIPDTLSLANVNAQVVDVLRTDTLTLPGQGAPTATPTTTEAIAYLFKAWRNKSDQSATTYQLYADDAATVDHKAAVSESGGTVTKGEVAAGP